jgi:hypothetical protein
MCACQPTLTDSCACVRSGPFHPKYIPSLPDPTAEFAFMMQRGIGQVRTLTHQSRGRGT